MIDVKNKVIIIFFILLLSNTVYGIKADIKPDLDFAKELPIREKIYKSDYNWGDQTLQFKEIIAVDNGYFVVGRQRSNQGLLIKLNNNLEKSWSLSFANLLKDIIKLDKKEFIVITDHQIIKLDQSGSEQWRKSYQATFNDLLRLTPNKFIIAGSKNDNGYLEVFSAAGDKIWNQTYITQGHGSLQTIIKTSSGNLVVGGEIKARESWRVDSTAWVLNVDKKGVINWEKRIARAAGWDASFLAVEETDQQDLVLVGADGYIIKLNQQGQKIWHKVHPGFTVNYTSLQESNSGHLILVGQQSVGRSYGGGADDYPYLVVLDSQGELVQEKVFKNGVEGGLENIIKIENNHYLAVGTAQGQSALHNTHGFLIEINPNLSAYDKLQVPFTTSNFIDYQAQEINLDFDLLSLSDTILTEVQLQSWADYYQFEEQAPLGSSWEDNGVAIILIHGFQAKAISKSDYGQALKLVFGQLVKRIVQDEKIEANEVKIYGCTWPTKIYSIEKNAQSLQRAINEIDELKYRDDIIIIAHSMGGILARSYIEQFGGAQKVQRLITISTPHQGVPQTLVYNWTRSQILQAMVDWVADNPLDVDFPGLRDTFATKRFYQLTGFQQQSGTNNISTNSFLEELNQNFAYYYDTGLYKLVGANVEGDQNLSFMYDLVADNYAGVQNDGLVATASALFDQEYSGIVKRSSHAAITEDEDVINAIINELDDLIYHLQLESDILEKSEKIKVEIYKKAASDKFRIYSQVLTAKQWSTANKEEKLTLQGWIETAHLGLSGQNWVEIYALNNGKEELITSFKVAKNLE